MGFAGPYKSNNKGDVMKIGHIAPHVYRMVSTESPFRFMLGQYLVPGSEYFEFLQEASAVGCFHMVDNGEAEGERVDSFETLVKQTERYVDEYILPDSFRNAAETLKLTVEAAPLVPPKKRAICPQGESFDEWFGNLEALYEALSGEFATICVPKHMERFSRADIVDRLVEYNIHCKFQIHLLGIWTDPISELNELGSLKQHVRSLDTGAALAWAQWTARVDETESGERFSLDWNDRECEKDVRDLAYINARLIREAANA